MTLTNTSAKSSTIGQAPMWPAQLDVGHTEEGDLLDRLSHSPPVVNGLVLGGSPYHPAHEGLASGGNGRVVVARQEDDQVLSSTKGPARDDRTSLTFARPQGGRRAYAAVAVAKRAGKLRFCYPDELLAIVCRAPDVGRVKQQCQAADA